jgi:hypothetical protein
MTLPVVYRRKVGRDLAGAYEWYEEQRTGLGEEFLAAIDASFSGIQQFPEMFGFAHAKSGVPSSRDFHTQFSSVSKRSGSLCSRYCIPRVIQSSGRSPVKTHADADAQEHSQELACPA